MALAGAMLSAVGCSYKADIEELNREVEALKGTVALQTDLQKIQSTVDQISSVNFSEFLKTADLAAKLNESGVAYSSQLTDFLTSEDVKDFLASDDVEALIEAHKYQTAEDVKALIAGLQTREDVEAVFDAMIKAYDIWAAVSGNVAEAITEALGEADFMTAESELSDAQVDQVKAALAQLFDAEGSDVKASIDAWLGKNFAKYMAEYEPTDAFIAKLGIGSSAVKAVLAEVKDANSDLVAEINALIAAATNGAVSETDLNTKLTSYNDRLTKLETKVAEIEGRIQSIVWVPQTMAEVQSNSVKLAARETLILTDPAKAALNADDKTKEFVLGESKTKVVWEVSPKSVLSKSDIKPENVELKIGEVTRAEEEALNWKVLEIDAEKGTVTVELSSAKQQNKQPGKTAPMIALHIAKPSEVEDGIGIDYTSNYIFVDQDNAKVYYGGGEKPETFSFKKEHTTAFNNDTPHVMEILYTKTGEISFLDGSAVVAETGMTSGPAPKPVYEAITERWDAFAEDGDLEIVITPEKDATGKDVVAIISDSKLKDLLTLAADGFTVKKSDKTLIDRNVTSGKFTYEIVGKKGSEYEGYSVELGTIAVKYTFTKLTKEPEVSAAEYVWTYKGRAYTSEALTVTGLDVETFNAIASLKGGELVDYSGKAPVVVATAELTPASTPTVDTDVKYLKMTVTVKDSTVLAKGGEFKAEFKGVAVGDDSKLTLSIPVTVKGAPVLEGLDIPAKVFDYNGGLTYTVLKADDKTGYVAQLVAKNKKLWDKVKNPQIEEDDFEELIKKYKASKDNKIKFYATEGALMVDFDDLEEVEGKVYPVALEYGFPGCEFKVSTSVSLVKPSVKLVPNGLLVKDGIATVNTELSKNENGTYTYEVEQTEFNKVFNTDKEVENCIVTYSVDFQLDKAGKPLDAQAEALLKMDEDKRPFFKDNILSWNGWTNNTLTVKAVATVGDEKLDEVTFTAKIVAPVKSIIVLDPKKNGLNHNIVVGETKDLKELVELMATTLDSDGKAAKVNLFGTGKLGADAEEANKALGSDFKYEIVSGANPLISIDKNGMLKVDETAVNLTETKIEIKITYTSKKHVGMDPIEEKLTITAKAK